MKKDLRQTILEKAFELFYEKGYDDTTISDIIDRAGVARGSFYYHFKGKDELLNSIADLLDEQYMEIEKDFPEGMNAFDKLVYMNARVHTYIEHNIPYDLIANQYSQQLVKTGGNNLLDRNRYYFRLMNKLIEEGKMEGSITRDKTTAEIARFYSMCERALITDWCMENGDYPLGVYSEQVFHCMIDKLRA
ncbi:MAG: TetR family transcriptional regulator [Clostridiales bacterium]|nr:TetR family transcriptional regulator [Candidatus Crickella merdequi]